MDFLYLLEKIRMPGLNELMLTVTQMGEETAFLVIAMVVFWCVDKKKGYLCGTKTSKRYGSHLALRPCCAQYRHLLHLRKENIRHHHIHLM